MATFVLVHSPSVGPATWQPVAAQLTELGHLAVVPSLLAVGDGGPPYWERVVSAVADCLASAGIPADEPVVLVAHSNAGVFVPVLTEGMHQPVSACIFADATVPVTEGRMPMAEEEYLPFLRGLTGPDGRLPRWSDWWSEEEVAGMFPSVEVRQTITAEEPRLPLEYYLDSVPVPAGWDDLPCGYLMFSDGYEEQAEIAHHRGWPVRTIPGDHLHQVVDPAGVSQALAAMAG
jgi:hypothetical protein